MTSTTWGALRKQADDATRPLPDDWYELVCAKADLKVASTGSLMIVCRFAVDEGPQQGKSAFTNIVFSPENSFALSMFFRNVAAFGFDDRFFAELEAQEVDPEDGLAIIAGQLPNRRVRAEIGTRQWQGQDRNEIKQFTASQVGAPNPRPVVDRTLVGGSPTDAPPVPGGVSRPSGIPPVGTSPGVPGVPPPAAPVVGAAPTLGAAPGAGAPAPIPPSF